MPLLEGVIASLLAAGAVKTTSKARKKTTKALRNRQFSKQLDPVAAEFNNALAERIESRADETENYQLQSIALHWEVIAEDIDAYEVVFETEKEAIQWLTDEVSSAADVDLNEETRNDLQNLLAEEFAAAINDFRNRLDSANIETRFQEDLGIEILQRVDEIASAFDRFADQRRYKLFSFPEEREAVLAEILPKNPISFIDRKEIPEVTDPDRHIVIGPSGSGKSRIITEWIRRLPESAIAHVLIPDKRMLSPIDVNMLSRESFDGDLLLVWEDIHRIGESREDIVLERTLRELEHALSDAGYNLYTLLEARSGRLDDIPGTLPADFKNRKSLWNAYTPLRVGGLNKRALYDIIDLMAAKFTIRLEPSVRDSLADRLAGSSSAPMYIETAFATANDQLRLEDVNDLPSNTEDIWRSQYQDLQANATNQWNVFAAAKILYDCNLPPFSRLIRAVYIDLFNGSEGLFRSSVRSLEKRQWLTIVGDDPVALETGYVAHDMQLEPIEVAAEEHIPTLSTILINETKHTVPESDQVFVHAASGNFFYERSHYTESEKQWKKALEIDPETAAVHNNYASVLVNELNQPESAAKHFQRAIQIEPERAEYLVNYANLLWQKLEQFDRAIDIYEQAIDADAESARAHYNYGKLLDEKLNRLSAAAEHYERAIQIDPENAAAHVDYGLLLRDKLEQPEKSARHFERAAEIDPDRPAILNNYGLALAEVLHEPEAAAEQYKRAIELDDSIADIHFNYGNALFKKLGRLESAANQYKQAIDIDPDISDYHVHYANVLSEGFEQYETAATHYERALELDPSNHFAHFNYATVLVQELNRLEDGADHYERVIETGLEHMGTFWFYHALNLIPVFVNLCELIEQPKRSIKYCERALELPAVYTPLDDQDLTYQIRVAYAKNSARPAAERIPELYRFGLDALSDRALDPSADLLTKAWELREENHDTAVFAGIWCIGLPTANIDKKEVKAAVESLSTSLSPVVTALWITFFTEEVPHTPSELQQLHPAAEENLARELQAYDVLYEHILN